MTGCAQPSQHPRKNQKRFSIIYPVSFTPYSLFLLAIPHDNQNKYIYLAYSWSAPSAAGPPGLPLLSKYNHFVQLLAAIKAVANSIALLTLTSFCSLNCYYNQGTYLGMTTLPHTLWWHRKQSDIECNKKGLLFFFSIRTLYMGNSSTPWEATLRCFCNYILIVRKKKKKQKTK